MDWALSQVLIEVSDEVAEIVSRLNSDSENGVRGGAVEAVDKESDSETWLKVGEEGGGLRRRAEDEEPMYAEKSKRV
jgi:hypothetical protein